jgi:predicted DNA-binding protein
MAGGPLDIGINRLACLLVDLYMVVHMKQILVEIDEEMAERLERVAPARSRRRSEFIRTAIGKALGETEEQRTAEAYRRQPDSADDACLDARAWEPATGGSRKASRK